MRRRAIPMLPLAGLLLLAAAWLPACSDSPSRPDEGTGRLQVLLTDAPAAYEDLQAMEITVGEVRVHRGTDAGGDADADSAAWIPVLDSTLPDSARTFDLLELVGGVTALLGDVELPAGHYTQLRLVIEAASITIGGRTLPLTVPSGAQSGLKLTGGFDVDPGVLTSLTLDFDAERSLVEMPPGSGDYKLKPTIRMMQTVLSGTISGTVTPPGIGALVSAYDAVADTLVATTHPDTAGAYVLQALLAGIYDVECHAAGHDTVRVEGVAVQAGQDSGGIDLALTPLPSTP